MTTKTRKPFSVESGDAVAYSVDFLRSIGQSHSTMARARGVVLDVQKLGSTSELAKIRWDDTDIPDRVNVQNLAKVGANTRFCQC